MFELQGIDHVAISVRDVHRSAEWYRLMLGLTRIHQDAWGDCPIVMAAGATAIALFPVGTPTPDPPPGRHVLSIRHIAFRVDASNFLRAREQLSRQGLAAEFQDHQIAQSIYFLDPDGHQIEITTYDLAERQSSSGGQ